MHEYCNNRCVHLNTKTLAESEVMHQKVVEKDMTVYCKTLIIHVTIFSRCEYLSYIRDLLYLVLYNTYIGNYWRGLYFRVYMLSRIYAKIKSSRIKSVFEYPSVHLLTVRRIDVNPVSTFIIAFFLTSHLKESVVLLNILSLVGWLVFVVSCFEDIRRCSDHLAISRHGSRR